MNKKLLGACFISEDVPKLVAFYHEILNLDYTGNESHVEFIIDGATLSIFSKSGMEQMAPGSTKEMICGNPVLIIKVDNIELEYERIKQLNVKIIKHLQKHDWGNQSFWIKDIDNNILSIVD